MSAGDEDQNDKPYEASHRKLENARKKGEIVRSQDVVAFAGVAVFGVGLMILLSGYLMQSVQGLKGFLASDRMLFDAQSLFPHAFHAIASIFGFLFLLPAICILFGLIAARQIIFTGDKVKPKLNRISIIANAKKKFGLSGFFDFAKNVLKFLTYALLFSYFLSHSFDYFQVAVLAGDYGILTSLNRVGLLWMWAAIGILFLFAVADAFWQFKEHARKNRMSHKEMKDENKAEEGDETVRQKRRAKAEEIATNRMLLDVPKATVVITNPTHYAVALQWDGQANTVPQCVAKGTDETARRIREIAVQSGVPLYRDPPTARDLFANVKIGLSIDSTHYKAVAAAIGYARRIQNKVMHERRR